MFQYAKAKQAQHKPQPATSHPKYWLPPQQRSQNSDTMHSLPIISELLRLPQARPQTQGLRRDGTVPSLFAADHRRAPSRRSCLRVCAVAAVSSQWHAPAVSMRRPEQAGSVQLRYLIICSSQAHCYERRKVTMWCLMLGLQTNGATAQQALELSELTAVGPLDG